MIPWDVLRRQRAAIAKLIDEVSDEVLLMWARTWTDLRNQIEAEVERRGQARMLTYSADYAGARLVEVAQRSSAVLADAARRLIELSLADAAALIGAQLPANWPLNRPAKPELDAIVQRATTQITSRMWALSDEATEAMRRRLMQGVAAGRNPRDTARLMVRDVQGDFDGGLARAQVIARTETIDAYRAGAKAHHEANSDVLAGWVWLAKLSERTCFPAGTAILTGRGERPIEQVAVGDRVITHTGRWRPVTELVQRDYSGPVVTVTTSAGSVTTTADHPFLVEREGQLQWVEAASIREGDVTLRFCDRGSDCLDHEVGHVAVERVVGQPYDLVASGAHMGVLPGVPVFRPRVPVTAVDLDNQIQSRQ